MRDAHHNQVKLLLFRILLACVFIASRAQPPNNLYTSELNCAADGTILGASQVDKIDSICVESEIYSSAMSKARVYADVNVLRPREYWDYEALTVQWG